MLARLRLLAGIPVIFKDDFRDSPCHPHHLHRVLKSRQSHRGFTFIEVLVASVIVALMAGGTMLAFLLAANLTQGSSTLGDAGFFNQQTLERFRNKVACRQPGEIASDTWFDASCAPALPAPDSPDTLPSGPLKDKFAGTRTYTVTPVDCDGVGGPGDCLSVMVKVQWTQPQ